MRLKLNASKKFPVTDGNQRVAGSIPLSDSEFFLRIKHEETFLLTFIINFKFSR